MDSNDGHKPDPLPEDSIADILHSSQLDQLDLDSSLSFLGDPAGLIESTLAAETGIVTPIDPPAFLTQHRGPPSLPPHANVTVSPGEAVLNPPLCVPDISDLTSLTPSIEGPAQPPPTLVPSQPFPPPPPASSSSSAEPVLLPTTSTLPASSIPQVPTIIPSSLSSPSSMPSLLQQKGASSSVPILQFLQQNFPKLHDDIKGLIHTSSGTEQTSQTTTGPGIFTASHSHTPKLTNGGMARVATPTTATRPPVFAQIIGSASNSSLPSSSLPSPVVLGRKSMPLIVPKPSSSTPSHTLTPSHTPTSAPRPPEQVIRATVAAIPAPSNTTPTLSLASHRTRQPSRTFTGIRREFNLRKTLVQPIEDELAEIDVGKPIQRCEYPSHLKEHSYCLYNPEEGARVAKLGKGGFQFTCSIPPVRLSYAPGIPESPTTLYKLLKVQPRKTSTSRTRSQQRPTSRQRSTSGRGTPLGRARKKAGRSKSGSRAGSEESHGSSSEHEQSDTESLSNRRRSLRNAGQRKRYVDDIEISLSDGEGILDDLEGGVGGGGGGGRKRRYKGYQEEESDYDDVGSASSSRSSKHKRTIAVNPTEGFRYSDIFLDPPPEEANIVEKILSHRVRESTEEEKERYGEQVEEFLVKYKN